MKEIPKDRYRLIKKLGEGGLGEVYLAIDLWKNQKVAIKIANKDNSSKGELDDFKQEYRLLKQLRHPGLVEAYDFAYSDGLPYFSMEYVVGRSLEDVFKQGGWKVLSILIGELCEVLEFIHQRGIIHCDLKPDNIKVTASPLVVLSRNVIARSPERKRGNSNLDSSPRSEQSQNHSNTVIASPDLSGRGNLRRVGLGAGSPKIKLLDFGLAEQKGSRINQQPKGTLHFMPPEVFKKAPLDERSDLYSLGVILYHAVTSKLPFSYSDPVRIVSAHLEENPTPPRKLNPDLPQTANELILKLLAKEPKERFQSASQLKDFLEHKEKPNQNLKSFPVEHLFCGGLFNRQKELDELWNGLESALEKGGKFFLIEGEAGIGKSALLDELQLKCQLGGIHFFRVKCLEKENQTYAPLIEALTHIFPYLKTRCHLLIAKYNQPLKLLAPQLKLDDGFSDASVLGNADATGFGNSYSRSIKKSEQESVGVALNLTRPTPRREGNSSPPNQTAPEKNNGLDESLAGQASPHKKQSESVETHYIEPVGDVESDKSNSYRDGHKDVSASVIPAEASGLAARQAGIQLLNDKQKSKPNPLHPGVEFSAQDQETLISGLADFLVEASVVFPFAICFEDLEFGGSGISSFLGKLGANINESRIFLCASVKTQEIEKTKDTKELINSLTNKEWFRTVELDRFNKEETSGFITSRLAGSHPPKEAIEYLYHHTSGNPLFLIETLKFLIQKEIITLASGKWDFNLEALEKEAIPGEIESVLLGNLARYDESTNKFLKIASLVGQRFDLESAKFLCGLSDDQIFEILFVLLKDEVLRKVTEQDELSYEFTSQSLQKLLYEKFSPTQRKKLHLKLADFLEDKETHGIPQAKEVLAFHYVNSTDYQKAYKYSLESAEETKRRFAHTQTLKHINNALKSAQKLKDQRKYLDALMRRGDSYNSIGELDKALKDYKEILKKARRIKDERFVACLYEHMSEAYRAKSDYSNTLAYSKKAIRLFTLLGDNLEKANTLNAVGDIYRANSQYDKALKAFDEALSIKKSFNDEESIAHTLANIGAVYFQKNHYQEARRYFEEHLKLVTKLDNKDQIARGLNNLGCVHYLLAEFDISTRYFSDSLQLYEEMGKRKEICNNYENLGQSFWESGNYLESLEYSKKALDLAGQIGLPRSADILLNTGRVYMELGQYEKSQDNFRESSGFAEETHNKSLIAPILLNSTKLHVILNDKEKRNELLGRAEELVKALRDDILLIDLYEVSGITSLREGKAEESLEYFKKAERIVEESNLKNRKLRLNLHFYESYCRLDQPKRAKEYLEQARQLAEISQSKSLKAEFYLKSAEYQMKQGNSDKSLADLKESFEIAEEIGKPELIWRIHHLWGNLNFSKGDFESAYKEFQKASEVLKGLANNIKDQDTRRSYLEDEEKKELFEDIRKVASLMVGVKV